MDIRHARKEDIQDILRLQGKYLVANLGTKDKSEGFVTTPFTPAQITEVIEAGNLFVAESENKIAAYLFTGSWTFFSQWPIFPYMSSRFPDILFNGSLLTTGNSFQYGPVCIDADFRNQGLLSVLFEFMRKELVKKYSIGATFINQLNKRSYSAHVRKLKWEVVDEFSYNGNLYWTLAYDMNQPVPAF